MSPPGQFLQLQEFWIIFKKLWGPSLCLVKQCSQCNKDHLQRRGKSSQLNAHLQTSSFSRPICRNNLSPFPRHNPHFLTDLETMAPMYLREEHTIKILCIMDIQSMIAQQFFEFYCVHNDFYFVNEAPLMRERLLRKLWYVKIKCQSRDLQLLVDRRRNQQSIMKTFVS